MPEPPRRPGNQRSRAQHRGLVRPTVVSEIGFEPSVPENAPADSPEGWLIGQRPVQEHPEKAAATMHRRLLETEP